MDQGLAPRPLRAQHRHELRTLTYFTLDQGNGGIVRNLTHQGIGVQAVAPVRARQQVRVRFELRYPTLFVATRGEVAWAKSSGQCGIRFLDLSPRTAREINEWIFGDMLEDAALHLERASSMFAEPRAGESTMTVEPALSDADEEDDGLMVSATARKVIELPTRPVTSGTTAEAVAESDEPSPSELDWLSQPLSGRGLIWTINTLVVVAALLLFACVFLSVTRELPRWPLPMSAGGAIVVGVLYWGFFRIFGGPSPGARLARLMGSDLADNEEEEGARFR